MDADKLISGRSIWDIEPDYRHYYQKRVLVTGACGSIGGAVYRQLKSAGAYVDGIDHSEGGVALSPSVSLGDYKDLKGSWEIIIHAAAYKHVVLGERNKLAFQQNNIWNLETFLENVSYDKFVLISTDKAAGTSWMGRTKREAERLSPRSIRLVNVAGSQGSVLDLWDPDKVNQIGPLDTKRYWMTMQDAVWAILEIPFEDPGLYTVHSVPEITLGELKDSFERACGPCSWVDMALREGEAKAERLVGDSEKLIPISHRLARVESRLES